MKIKENIKKAIRVFGYPVRYYRRKKKKIDSEELGLDLIDLHFSPPKSAAEIKKYIRVLSKLNISWVRVSFDWYSFRKNRKNYFSLMNKLIDSLKSENFDILGVICNIVPGNFLNMISPNKNLYLPPIDYFQDFLDFTKKIVIYYKKKIKHWEFMNEPDTKRHWIYEPNPKSYKEMLKSAYMNIKEIDSNLKVISGGLAEIGLNLDPKSKFHSPYLKELISLGFSDYCDIIGIHVWPLSSYIGLSFEPSFYAKEIIKKTKTIVGFIKKSHINRDIWITETGINPMWSLLNEKRASESYQLVIEKLFGFNIIKKIFIFNFRDFPNKKYEFFNPDPYFGLVSKDYKIKESANFLINKK